MRLNVVFLVLVLLLACPADVLAADFDWTLTWQNGQILTETITTDDPDLINPEGGWQRQSGQPDTFTRQIEGWTSYNQLSDRLPIVAKTKNYVAVKITKITLDSQTYKEGTTFYDLTAARSGQVKMEVPGFIMKARPAVKSQWPEGFAATWAIATQAETEEYRFAMTAITIEILPSVISLLVIGWGLIWIVYRRQVKRMERLIDARYSLDNVVQAEIPTIEQAEDKPDI
ncbi:MAG TPA: hypothetical protein DER60_12805 [Syntrophomonas sp.]|jgi:hypothetical protein|nr:hypothetical protein [Syntrophomonas sp.]